MYNRTIEQIINDVKAGNVPEPNECVSTMLALYSMLACSQMAIETIAAHIGNETNVHTVAKCLFGNLNSVREERYNNIESNPDVWLKVNCINNNET